MVSKLQNCGTITSYQWFVWAFLIFPRSKVPLLCHGQSNSRWNKTRYTLVMNKHILDRFLEWQLNLQPSLQTVPISGPACDAVLPQPPTLCPSTSTGYLNLSFVKAPPPLSTNQCPITTSRLPVQLTPIGKDLPSTTLQTGAECGNPSEARIPSSIQSDRHESQGIASKIITKLLFFLQKSHTKWRYYYWT